jgi:hypothetical protein
MKLRALFLCVFLFPLTTAAKTILPDACGDDHVKFDVHAEKDQPAPAEPVDGKAQLILIEDQNGRDKAFSQATVRYGLDGAWAGADYGSSYFAVPIEPGAHHLCASWEGDKHGVSALSFTAEAGKTYYFAAQIAVTGGGGGGYIPPNGLGAGGGGFVRPVAANKSFNLVRLSEDEGKYRTKAWKLAVSKPK